MLAFRTVTYCTENEETPCRDDVLTAIEQEPDDMPAEIDFSKGERGKFKPKGR